MYVTGVPHDKTELVWFGSTANLRKTSPTNLTLSVGDDVITPVDAVRDLGVHLNAELTMKQHVISTARVFQLRDFAGYDVGPVPKSLKG